MSYSTPAQAMINAGILMQAGAHIIKIEGGAWLAESVSLLADRGVPVCAHLGLTPQAVNRLGGYRVQGRDEASAKQMIDDAILLEQAGASMLLLECVPSSLAGDIARTVSIPVIGIGAGPDTDAQVLVLHDILGITSGRKPRFVKDFMAEADDISGAIKNYGDQVRAGTFPADEHGFA
jgi:3-methyl-2-oxobutanoate hydroxymethyltransferase